MALSDLSKLQGSFGYKLCALYLPQRDKSGAMSEALRMLVGGLGEEWRDKATFDDVCMELEFAGVGYAGTMRSSVLAKLGESIEEEHTHASEAAGWISMQDHKLAVWVACACARETLKYVTKGENRPSIAIETAEAWVRGEATEEQVAEAREVAKAATSYASADARHAAWAAAYAARTVYSTEAYPAASASASASASYAYAAGSTAWSAARDGELRRLVSVIARSLQTFPVLLTAPE